MKTNKPLWPIGIIVLGVGFIIITAWSIYRANSGVSSVTDPSYYSHGLKYNQTSIETTAAQTMGWVLKPTVSPTHITLSLSDHKGTLITGCAGTITFLAHPDSARLATTTELTDLGAGTYQAPLPPDLQTNTSATVTLSKGRATIHRNLLINL